MPRTPLSREQRIEYKVKDLKGWVIKQMKLNRKKQTDVAKVLGVSQSRLSVMLKIPDPKESRGRPVNPDPFTYGQIVNLCDFFGVSGEERERLLTL